jgi:hypothetical protein
LSGVRRMRAQRRAVALVLTRPYIYLRAACLHLDITNTNLDTRCAKLGEILVSIEQEAKGSSVSMTHVLAQRRKQ